MSRGKLHTGLAGAVLLCLAAVVAAGPSTPATAQVAEASESAPFSNFGGSWNGSGTIQKSTGETERLRCRATYEVRDSGNAMQQNLQCTSDTYTFELRSSVSHNDGVLSGNWRDTNRGIEGTISGRGKAGEMRVAAQSPQFSASITIQTRGNRQVVTIRSPGTELTNVSITMSRGRG